MAVTFFYEPFEAARSFPSISLRLLLTLVDITFE